MALEARAKPFRCKGIGVAATRNEKAFVAV